jgi:hypothetical protein
VTNKEHNLSPVANKEYQLFLMAGKKFPLKKIRVQGVTWCCFLFFSGKIFIQRTMDGVVVTFIHHMSIRCCALSSTETLVPGSLCMPW